MAALAALAAARRWGQSSSLLNFWTAQEKVHGYLTLGTPTFNLFMVEVSDSHDI